LQAACNKRSLSLIQWYMGIEAECSNKDFIANSVGLMDKLFIFAFFQNVFLKELNL